MAPVVCCPILCLSHGNLSGAKQIQDLLNSKFRNKQVFHIQTSLIYLKTENLKVRKKNGPSSMLQEFRENRLTPVISICNHHWTEEMTSTHAARCWYHSRYALQHASRRFLSGSCWGHMPYTSWPSADYNPDLVTFQVNLLIRWTAWHSARGPLFWGSYF